MITPGILSIGLVVGPVVAVSALISSNATNRRIPAQYAVWLPPPNGVRWDAAPMKKSMGIENTTLVREARNARRAATGATGFACPPDAVVRADAITMCCFGQITATTLRNIIVPNSAPVRMVIAHGVDQAALPS